MCIEKTGAVHLPRWADPVKRKGQSSPSSLWAQFFLAHVVRPATATLTNAATHHEHIDDAAVVHVAVIPMVHGGTNDDH